MSAEKSPSEDDAAGRTGSDPITLSEPLVDADAGVAVDDDPDQVDLNTDQWDTE